MRGEPLPWHQPTLQDAKYSLGDAVGQEGQGLELGPCE